VTEVEIMMKTKTKAEIQALSSYGFQYLSEAGRRRLKPAETRVESAWSSA